MNTEVPLTLESFYQFCAQGKLVGTRCRSCGEILTPPRSLCRKCHSTDMEWMEFKGTGKLLTYSIIHVAPSAFQSLVPYTVGIVQLTEGARLPGMIRVEPKDLRIGLELKVAFDLSRSENWPQWTRYYFVRTDSA
jgi:uncharacterized OB-fold protein